MTREKVAIYGTGPNCTLQKADHSYFANYAALRYSEDELKRCEGTVNLIGNVTSMIPDKAVLLWDMEAYVAYEKKLSSYALDHRILFATKTRYHAMFDGREGVEYIPPEVLYEIIQTTLGRTMFFRWPHLLGGVLRNARRKRRMLKQALFGGADTDAYFRPSTGVMALIIALHRHGPECRYDMQGFEFVRRSHDHVTQSVFAEKSDWYLPHLEADRMVIRQILGMGVELSYPEWDTNA